MAEHTIPSLVKAIDVMEAVADGRGGTSVSALAKSLGLSQTTCYRIIQTFCSRDWLRTRSGGGYAVSHGMLPILRCITPRQQLIETLRPVVEALATQTGVSAKAAVREGDLAVTLVRAEAPSPMALSGRVGATFSLALGSSGSALLAELSDEDIRRVIENAPAHVWEKQTSKDVWKRVRECRRKGHCRDFGGYKSHIYTISAPIRGEDGSALAALTIMGLPDEFSEANLKRLTSALRAAADEAAAKQTIHG